MKRRDFIKAAAVTAVAASTLNPISLLAQDPPHGQRPPQGPPPQGGFPGMPGFNSEPVVYNPTGPGIKVRFLGTGAADWRGPREDGELRRNSSVLLDSKVLIDFTKTSKDMLPENAHPEVIFYTHSHGDHYDPKSALEIGIKRVYLGETWLDRAKDDFKKASEETGKPMPEITPLAVGQQVDAEGFTFMALPANHTSDHIDEQTLIYLVQKDSTRLLYATDTGGLMSQATKRAGIDLMSMSRERTFLTGIIMEATMGYGYEDDWRIFTHSSVATVETTVKVLKSTQKYVPFENQKAYITHMSKSCHGSQADIESHLSENLAAAYDGLEVTFR